MPRKKQQNKKTDNKPRKDSRSQEEIRLEDERVLAAEMDARKQEELAKLAEEKRINDTELPMYRAMPKIELHAHLSGSLSARTIATLTEFCSHHGVGPVEGYQLQQPENMNKVFDSFAVVQRILQTPTALHIAIRETIREFMEDGCVYLELRTTPKRTDYMNYETYIRTCAIAVRESSLEFPAIKVFLIISLDRTMTYAIGSHILDVIGKIRGEFPTNIIAGIELSGKPSQDGQHLLQVLQIARRFHGLGVTVHLAEVKENMGEVHEFLMFAPDRIGHGTFLHTNKKAVELMKNLKIPIEICLSSNVYSKTVPTIEDSHFKFWRDNGVPVSINTDDKGVIPNCTLTEEYFKAAKAFNLSTEDLIEINRNALRASFAYKYQSTDLSEVWRKIETNSLQ